MSATNRPRRRGSVPRAAGMVVGLSAVIIAAWYLAMLGTKSPVMLVAIGLGYGVAFGLTKGLDRHGPGVAAWAVGLTVVALIVALFYVNRWQLNRDPRNHIPAWANPSWVTETLKVGLGAWPTQWIWIAGSLAVAGFIGWRGIEVPHHVAHLQHRDGASPTADREPD